MQFFTYLDDDLTTHFHQVELSIIKTLNKLSGPLRRGKGLKYILHARICDIK